MLGQFVAKQAQQRNIYTVIITFMPVWGSRGSFSGCFHGGEGTRRSTVRVSRDSPFSTSASRGTPPRLFRSTSEDNPAWRFPAKSGPPADRVLVVMERARPREAWTGHPREFGRMYGLGRPPVSDSRRVAWRTGAG